MEDILKTKSEKMEEDLKKWKTTSKINKKCSRFLSILGANLSWGWLSSLRFFSHSMDIKPPRPYLLRGHQVGNVETWSVSTNPWPA